MGPDKVLRIIYIEDDPEMIDLVTIILTRQGHLVKGTTSGVEGVELIFREHPDIILLDLMIPDMDGWDIYHRIKSDSRTQNIPVIVITARTLEIDRVLGMHIAKVDAYINKPFSPQELVTEIYNIVSAPKKDSTSIEA